jgi:hypothetical protein
MTLPKSVIGDFYWRRVLANMHALLSVKMYSFSELTSLIHRVRGALLVLAHAQIKYTAAVDVASNQSLIVRFASIL